MHMDCKCLLNGPTGQEEDEDYAIFMKSLFTEDVGDSTVEMYLDDDDEEEFQLDPANDAEEQNTNESQINETGTEVQQDSDPMNTEFDSWPDEFHEVDPVELQEELGWLAEADSCYDNTSNFFSNYRFYRCDHLKHFTHIALTLKLYCRNLH